MAAGLGFKTFTTGEVLTAADTNGYLMQGVLVFASAAARDAAITSPQEGQFAYLKDTNVTTYYTGSAWANLDTTGMTNPMTTTGDMIYSSSGSTPARLGIGTAGQVLKVNSGATAPEWGAVTGGGKVLQVVSELEQTSVSNATTTYTDSNLAVTITPSSATSKVLILYTVSWLKSADNLGNSMWLRLVRGATNLTADLESIGETASTLLGRGVVALGFLDTPNTTSATTYKVQFRNALAASTVTCQPEASSSSMILMEIGA